MASVLAPDRADPTAAPTAPLLIRVLGPLEISWLGRPLAITRRQARALLLRLATHLQPVARDDLLFLFWPDARETVARRNLTHLLTHLRRALPQPDLLQLTDDYVSLNPGLAWSDAAAFAALCATPTGAGRRAALRRALELYRGPFLQGLTTPDSPEYEQWLEHERETLYSTYRTAVSAVLSQCQAEGDYETGISLAQQYLAQDDTREEIHRSLMVLYALNGNRDAALRQFDRLVISLERELGAQPLDTTRMLYRAILDGHLERLQQPQTRPTWVALPGGDVPLMGRDGALRQLQQQFARAQSRQGHVVWISGEPGIGKTRLMHEFVNAAREQTETLVCVGGAQRSEHAIPYQVVSEALRSLPDLPTLVTQVAPVWRQQAARLLPELALDQAAAPLPDAADPAESRLHLLNALSQIVLHLAEVRPLILCLDDLHWADAATFDWLAYLGRRLYGSRILVVAALRSEEAEPLHEVRHTLARAGVLTEIDLVALNVLQVRSLVQFMAGSAVLDDTRVVQLHRATGGNPFFLLATLRALLEAGHWPSAETASQETDLPLPDNVRQAVEMRLQRLTPLARQLLEAAAVLGNAMRREVLYLTAGRDELESVNATEELLARQLLAEQAAGYHFLHELVRSVVYQHLSVGRRLLLHHRAAEAMEKIFASEISALSQHDKPGAAPRRPARGLNLSDDELLAALALHHATGHRDDQDTDKAATYLLLLGDRARGLFAHRAAVEAYEQALALLEQRGEYEQSARTLMKLALTHHTAFQFPEAREAYERGFALWQRSSSQPLAPVARQPQTLRINWTEPTALDPAQTWEFYTSGTADLLFRGLLERTPDLGVVPAVARAWDVRDGGLTYVFHLREDVRWSDDRPVTAGDFEYAWKRILGGMQRSPFLGLSFDDIKGAEAYRQGRLAPIDQVGVRALDDLTLLVELEQPTSYFLQLMACSAWFPAPQHVVEKYGPAWTQPEHFVSNGPYRLAAWQPGQRLSLVRNTAYFGRFAGNVERVELALGLSYDAGLAAYEADQLDVLNLEGASPAMQDRARQRFPDDYVSLPTLRSWILQFDASQPPFDNPLLRRALTLALDRTYLAEVVQRGYEFPASGGFIPPGMPGHSPGLALPYDPPAARDALAAAGYPGGRGLPRLAGLSHAGTDPICQYAQQQWRQQLGVQVDWDIVPVGLLVERLLARRPALRITAWAADFPDPDNFLREVIFRRIYGGWRYPQYQALVEEARVTPHQDKRMRLYQAAEQILIREAALVPLLYARYSLLLKPRIKRFPTSALEWWFWKDVLIEP
jgi:ABC-type oligopeptide transport system substrate-binding subunit/DNA-binding SARP family transcriptional activator